MTSSNSLAKKTKKLHVSFCHLITNTRVKKKYNLNFPFHNTLAAIPSSEILTNPPRSNSTIGNPHESSSVSSEKHHVYCFPSVPLIIKIKGYKTKTTKHVNKMYFVIVANGRRLQTAFPIKLVTNMKLEDPRS